jgi:endonuclease/exonuclease/phosphatase family metal-dependent hydrolase
MFAELEAYAHRLRRRLSRSEWAIRHLGLTPSEGTSEQPGLLLIQIDGLARAQMERAMAGGRMPFLRRLIKRNHYDLHTFYPGLPSTTPAVQAELYYGLHSAVPAFCFMNRETKELGRMFYPTWAKEFETRYAAKAEGLLTGGSSWSNIYTGGAGQGESHFCMASNGLGDMWRTGKIRNILVFIMLQLTATLRIAGLLVVETAIALWDAMAGIRRGQSVSTELFFAVSRIFVSVGLRELVTIGAKVDVARGLPIVHVNLLGYDEQSHARGPGSVFAHWSLRGIDRAIKGLYREAHRSARRDYSVWIFSDHGQERTRSFATEVPGGIEGVVRDCYEVARKVDRAWRPRSQTRYPSLWLSRGRRAEKMLARLRAGDALTTEEQATFTVAAVGPVGHIYFAQPLSGEQRAALARRLVTQGKVPGVLLRAENGQITWFHARGETRVPDEVPALLPHPEAMREEIARDLVTFCENANSGDLILLGWCPWERPWTFAPERGAHAGPGPEETQGFVLLPARTRLPAGTEHFIRPAALRSAALQHLGRHDVPRAVANTAKKPKLRVMTYNVHGCGGMDGRVSPRRVARVIGAYDADIVALQEIDLGRRRSRAEDQAALIARELNLNQVFCPTVTHGEEHYGHALLTPWPVEVIKRARLPADPNKLSREPRAALWARVTIDGRAVNVITTHLGLGLAERAAQVEALLGPEWIGGLPEDEPAILCGDFNLPPGTAPYRRIVARLGDAQLILPGHRALRTFSSARPFMRIDHIFLTPHFEARGILVPRTDLTRISSDHLPLVADLQLRPSSAGKPTTTQSAPPRHNTPSPLSVSE